MRAWSCSIGQVLSARVQAGTRRSPDSQIENFGLIRAAPISTSSKLISIGTGASEQPVSKGGPCPSLSFIHFQDTDKDSPNFHSVEIDRYWDRHPARFVSRACLTALGLLLVWVGMWRGGNQVFSSRKRVTRITSLRGAKRTRITRSLFMNPGITSRSPFINPR
jgi:hypothetical protein